MNNLNFRIMSIFLAVLGLAVCQVALAQPIEVTSANPNTTIQGTSNLDVEIAGDGFDSQVDAVEFLLPCPPEEEPCTDTGGITVKGWSVRGKRKIIANIDVAVDADVADFDIAVHSASGGGRGGKGTTLFSVQPNGGGGGTGSTLSAKFCLNMTVENPGLSSDGQTVPNTIYDYCDDKKERVMIFTGSHAGFRFDSNTKNLAPKRSVEVNFPGGQVTVEDDDGFLLNTFYSGDYQIDLRFDRKNGGLDLGSMQLDSEPGAPGYFVPVNLWMLAVPNQITDFALLALAYSESTDPLHAGELIGNTCVTDYTLDAQVKRLAEDRWSIESNPLNQTACLWVFNSYENYTGTPIVLPFYFEFEIK